MKKRLGVRDTKKLRRLVEETKRKLDDGVAGWDGNWLLRNEVLPELETILTDPEEEDG